MATYVTPFEAPCKAFAFFVHYFLLVTVACIITMSFFKVWEPYTSQKKRVAIGVAVGLSWGKQTVLKCLSCWLILSLFVLALPLIIAVVSVAAASDRYFNEEL